MPHLLDPASWPALDNWLAARGLPKYRAAQVRKGVFGGRAESFDALSGLPKAMRADLAAEFTLWTTTVKEHKQSPDGTEKLLLALHDDQVIECVLLRDGQRRTICISSQVGCAMGCVFCASGLDGVIRNLTAGEIVEQMLRLEHLLPADERLSHIVVMGMGEPLANLKGVLPALGEATDPTGLGISARRITISTVGLPESIRRLAAENSPFHLAVSLHAPDDELRTKLVPVNKNVGIRPILTAADEYFAATGRRLTFEYVLLGGLNDRPSQADGLVRILRGRNALLNVIPYNPVAGLPYVSPAPAAVERFLGILRHGGVNVQIRERKGDSIDAACGQLRRIRTQAEPQVVELGVPGN